MFLAPSNVFKTVFSENQVPLASAELDVQVQVSTACSGAVRLVLHPRMHFVAFFQTGVLGSLQTQTEKRISFLKGFVLWLRY